MRGRIEGARSAFRVREPQPETVTSAGRPPPGSGSSSRSRGGSKAHAGAPGCGCAGGGRSAATRCPPIRWIRSYVVHERDGGLGTFCFYQASSPEKIREHVERAGIPATDILEIVDTVIVRPDPVAVAAWVARLFEGRVHRALALAIVHEDEQAGAGRLGSAASRRPRRRERCRRPGLSLLSAGRPDGLNRLREVARARRLGAR